MGKMKGSNLDTNLVVEVEANSSQRSNSSEIQETNEINKEINSNENSNYMLTINDFH